MEPGIRRQKHRVDSVRLKGLGRSLKELLEIVEDLKERGIHLVSLEEEVDTPSAAGELVFHVFGAIAHFERRLIAERTRDGQEARQEAGTTAAPRREGFRGEKAHQGRNDAWSGRKAAEHRQGNGLQDRAVAPLIPDVPDSFLLSVIQRTNHAMTPISRDGCTRR